MHETKPVITSHLVGPRRRLSGILSNPGGSLVDLTLYASGLTLDDYQPFSGSQTVTVAPGTFTTIALDLPSGFITEAGIQVTNQDASDLGVRYLCAIFIRDEDVGGRDFTLFSGAVTAFVPGVWPQTATSSDPLTSYLSTFVTTPAASHTHTLPPGAIGWPVHITASLNISSSASVFHASLIPITAINPYVVGIIQVPSLSVPSDVFMSPGIQVVTSPPFLTAPLSGTLAAPSSSIDLVRYSSDHSAVIAESMITWRIHPA
jgi:hypothetical protein